MLNNINCVSMQGGLLKTNYFKPTSRPIPEGYYMKPTVLSKNYVPEKNCWFNRVKNYLKNYFKDYFGIQ